MKTSEKLIGLIAALTMTAGVLPLYACDTCGCQNKPTVETTECSTNKTAEGAEEACNLGKDTKLDAQITDHTITTLQLEAYVDSGKATLLDARSGTYDDGFRIPGAKSLNAKSTAEEIAAVVPEKDALIITYCSNLQCPASKLLAEHLKKLGYTQVLEYPDGIAGWRAAGGKVDPVK